MCMMFYRRDTHVAEIQIGNSTARLEDACVPENFDVNKLPFVTLLGKNFACSPMRILYTNSITCTQSVQRYIADAMHI